MSPVKSASLALRFLLELCVLAALVNATLLHVWGLDEDVGAVSEEPARRRG